MKPAVISKERMYEVIRGPVITEKATMQSEHNQVTFPPFSSCSGSR